MAFTASDVRARRCVIFDFDGTIADTMTRICDKAREILHEYGLDDEAIGDIRRIVGPPFPQAFTMIYGFSEEQAAEIAAKYRRSYTDDIGPEGWPLFDGIAEMLIKLRADGCELAVASSKGQYLIDRAMSDNGITSLFTASEGKRSDAENDKVTTIRRAIAEVNRVVEEQGMPAFGLDECVMVGDRHYDIDAAREVGIPCIGVTWGGTCERDELVQAGAAVIVDTPDQLVQAIL